MTFAPRPERFSIVGKAARIRRSSVIRPSSSTGTLKSTRTNTLFPFTSISFMESFFISPRSLNEDFQLLASTNHRRPLTPVVCLHGANAPDDLSTAFLQPFLNHQGSQIHDPAGITPFIVVPGDYLHHVVVNDHGGEAADNRRMGVSVEVDGYQSFLSVSQN